MHFDKSGNIILKIIQIQNSIQDPNLTINKS